MKIVVAYGGTSPEREVSLKSGAAVARALSDGGHSVCLEDVTSPRDFVMKWDSFEADGVFVALHGGWGEDGRLQTCMDEFGIPYTGSGPEACMLAMDKNVARLLFTLNGVPVPEGHVVQRGSSCGAREKKLLSEFGRLIVKPNSGGSTVGVTQATTMEELIDGVRASLGAYECEDKALIERYIDGKELTVPVLEQENGEIAALPIIDIRPKSGFYDYTNKYTSGCTEYLCPAPLPQEMTDLIGKYAVAAHNSLGCRVYSRVDFRLTEDGRLYALEVNTAPGMTATSLVPKSAAALGISFTKFLEGVINVSFNIKRRF